MKKGKMRLVALRDVQTDFGQVLDLSRPETLPAGEFDSIELSPGSGLQVCMFHQARSTWVRAAIRPTQPTSPQGARVLHSRSHPGLFLLPGLLTPQQQQSLGRRSLEQFCEPPARTNHFVHLGWTRGLWQAAQQGLRWEGEERRAIVPAQYQWKTPHLLPAGWPRRGRGPPGRKRRTGAPAKGRPPAARRTRGPPHPGRQQSRPLHPPRIPSGRRVARANPQRSCCASCGGPPLAPTSIGACAPTTQPSSTGLCPRTSGGSLPR